MRPKNSSSTPTDREIREKLATRGVRELSDAELLSIIVQDGEEGCTALELAQQLLESQSGSLLKLSNTNIRSLRMTAGLGIKKAAVVLAALELGNRMQVEASGNSTVINSSEDVVTMFRPVIGSLPHEELWVVYLSSANGVLDKIRVSQGGVNKTVVDHKLIVKRAVELLASGVIITHNHPSGMTEVSTEDRELTDRLATALSLFDITLLDHIIITASDSLSFKYLGLI